MGAVKVVKQSKQPCSPVVGNVVEQLLGFAAEGDDAVLAEAREMLRQGRLAQAHPLAERGHAEFTRGREVAQDEEPLLIGQCTKQCRGLVRLRGELFERWSGYLHINNI